MKKILIVLVIGVSLAFGALNYHFILTDKSIKVLKKVGLTLENTFVDARGTKKIKLYFKAHLPFS
ncbi:MAG: hypothetical protein U9N37_04660 [Thermodesulfobacteriota bacterium]|nr:hypothetical protein [Thermodesulfobacteriota bacterium]